ncbi:hypothetical protein AQUCO_07200159v1 [Aquilegia coerulea]|uniref:Uncharacterized protein n=1 Tax=Aquilegia coerulea TaxID=218851 RepID=A0A2G5CAK3_AQUCA|nr:hypothetical protein AQUCO_07200159v1 [Aquilegia coerulea]
MPSSCPNFRNTVLCDTLKSNTRQPLFSLVSVHFRLPFLYPRHKKWGSNFRVNLRGLGSKPLFGFFRV